MGKLFFSVQNLIIWVMIVLAQTNGCKSCVEKERKGLLEFKASLKSVSDYNRDTVLGDWTNDTKSDCCQWERVECDLTSGRVIGLSLYLLYLPDPYPHLNLSLLYPFEELQSLDLSLNYFGGWFDDVEGHQSLKRLRKLEILDLCGGGYNNSIWPFLSVATSLKTLFLCSNNMYGPFPIKELKSLQNLQVLDLGKNNFNDSLPVQELVVLKKLEELDLSGNKFSGSLETQGLCELKNLRELDLSKNKFVGQIPQCFGSLTKLRVLDLSSNQLSGKLPTVVSSLESLEYLTLSNNKFEGMFSFSSLANLSKLKVFELSSEPNLLQVEAESSWQPKFELIFLALPYCNLEEIPSFLRYQTELLLIDLSNNRLSGNFPTWLLENNPKLEVLRLQNNSFRMLRLPRVTHNLQTLDVSANDFDDLLPENIGRLLPNLRLMNLADNGFQGNLPSSLSEMKRIFSLDLSRNNFSGRLPTSLVMGCYSLNTLKLSHNKFSGQIFPQSANLTSLTVLTMDNNQFTGKIGDGFLNMSRLVMLDISSNFLTGAIPRWMGNPRFAYMLLMSDNLLEGTIPVSQFKNSTFVMLDISENKLSGTLPPRFRTSNIYGGMLYLHDNNFTGPIPDTLLANVSILDVRNNRLSGSIPQFVNTQNISILLLRGNNLTGPIPKKLCELNNIRLLDLAYNRLNGSIPSCLNNVSFGLGDVEQPDYNTWPGFVYNSPFDYESVLAVGQSTLELNINLTTEIEFATKRRYYSYAKGTLPYMFGLDLSSNELSDEMPEELGDLQKLRSLNLSHNNLSGFVPKSFSNLKDMESLDLSFNRLCGQIPPQLTSLNSLAVFNVSYNNLSGTIPRGWQFNTFDESSYIGNSLLRGPATNRSFGANSSETPYYERNDDETAIDMVVFNWSFASTYAAVLMGILVFLCFDSPWRRSWLRLVDAFIRSVKTIGS